MIQPLLRYSQLAEGVGNVSNSLVNVIAIRQGVGLTTQYVVTD